MQKVSSLIPSNECLKIIGTESSARFQGLAPSTRVVVAQQQLNVSRVLCMNFAQKLLCELEAMRLKYTTWYEEGLRRESFFMLSNSWDWSHEAAFGCCTCHYNLTSLHPPPLLSFLHPFLVFAILRRQEDSRKEKRTSLNFWQNCECPFLIMTLVSYDLFHPQLPPLRREDTILGCWAIYK